MKPVFLLTLLLGLGLARAVSPAQCETHSSLTYCLAGASDWVQYQAHAERSFAAILFAEQARIDGLDQTDFAGQLAEGSRVLFRNGVVVILPKGAVDTLASFARFLGKPEASNQALVICLRMKVGDSCEASQAKFQPWSIALWVSVFPVKGTLGYSILFRSRNSRIDPTLHSLPKEPFVGDCTCENSEYPGIWVLLKQKALAGFSLPQDAVAGGSKP